MTTFDNLCKGNRGAEGARTQFCRKCGAYAAASGPHGDGDAGGASFSDAVSRGDESGGKGPERRGIRLKKQKGEVFSEKRLTKGGKKSKLKLS